MTTDKFLVAFDLETLQDLPDREPLEDGGWGLPGLVQSQQAGTFGEWANGQAVMCLTQPLSDRVDFYSSIIAIE